METIVTSDFLIDRLQEYPNYVAYTTSNFFVDDWLNLYLDSYRMHADNDNYQKMNEISCSDYRFVYMGAKGLIINSFSEDMLMFFNPSMLKVC